MLSVAKLAFARTGKPNRHALHDVGLASAQLALQATALGYAAKIDDLPDEARQKALAPRQRKPLGDFVFSRTWGEPAALLTHSQSTKF